MVLATPAGQSLAPSTVLLRGLTRAGQLYVSKKQLWLDAWVEIFRKNW